MVYDRKNSWQCSSATLFRQIWGWRMSMDDFGWKLTWFIHVCCLHKQCPPFVHIRVVRWVMTCAFNVYFGKQFLSTTRKSASCNRFRTFTRWTWKLLWCVHSHITSHVLTFQAHSKHSSAPRKIGLIFARQRIIDLVFSASYFIRILVCMHTCWHISGVLLC